MRTASASKREPSEDDDDDDDDGLPDAGVCSYAPKKQQLWSRWGTNLPQDIKNGKTRPIRLPSNTGEECRSFEER